MWKSFFLTTTILAGALAGTATLAGPASAQQGEQADVRVPGETVQQTGPRTSTAYSRPGLAPGAMIGEDEVLASELIGQEVFAETADDEREFALVEDAILDSDGRLKGLILAANDVFGVEGNRYVVPLQRLSIEPQTGGELSLTTDITEEELTGAPDYSSTTQAPANDTVAAEAGNELYVSDRAARIATTTDRRELAEGARNIGAEIQAQVEIAEGMAQGAGTSGAQEVQRGLIAGRIGEEPDAPQEITTQAAGSISADVTTTGSVDPANYGTRVELEDMDAQSLLDVPVMTGDGEVTGNTEDIIVRTGGAAQAVLVDVGGFLGIDDRRVAIPLEKAQIVRGADGGYAIFTSLTRAELEAMAPYDAQDVQ